MEASIWQNSVIVALKPSVLRVQEFGYCTTLNDLQQSPHWTSLSSHPILDCGSLPGRPRQGSLLITPPAANRVQAPRTIHQIAQARAETLRPKARGFLEAWETQTGHRESDWHSSSDIEYCLIRCKRGERLSFGGSDRFVAAEI